MIDLNIIIRQLTGNAEAMRALVQTITDEQAQWKQNAETRSMKDVMEHIYNEERIDFRMHLKEMLNDPPLAWGEGSPREYQRVANCHEALNGFLIEREASIAWLQERQATDWNIETKATFGPTEVIILRAGDVLTSWVEHDFLHLRQMIEILYAWTEQQAAPYSVQYAGGW